MSKAKTIRIEFSRPLPIERVPRKGSHEHITADAVECAGLAKRFAIPAIHSFKARLLVSPWRGGGAKVTGTVEADVERQSVVSMEQFRELLAFPVLRYFLPAGMVADPAEDEADPIVGGAIDLGEIAAETFGLELNPYPRKAGEGFELVGEQPKV